MFMFAVQAYVLIAVATLIFNFISEVALYEGERVGHQSTESIFTRSVVYGLLWLPLIFLFREEVSEKIKKRFNQS